MTSSTKNECYPTPPNQDVNQKKAREANGSSNRSKLGEGAKRYVAKPMNKKASKKIWFNPPKLGGENNWSHDQKMCG